MGTEFVVVGIGIASLLYATAGQAGGTAFLAAMTFAAVPASEMRPTALFLNVLAGGYSTWRMHRARVVDWGAFDPFAFAVKGKLFGWNPIISSDQGIWLKRPDGTIISPDQAKVSISAP